MTPLPNVGMDLRYPRPSLSGYAWYDYGMTPLEKELETALLDIYYKCKSIGYPRGTPKSGH